MKKALILGLGLALALLLSGCGMVLSMIGGGGGESFIHGENVTLSGKLLNWPGGTGTIYNVHSEPQELGQTNPMTGPVQDDGSFTLTLTYPPSWNALDTLDDCGGAIKISDPTVQVTEFMAQVKDQNGTPIGSAEERNTNTPGPEKGAKLMMYIFAEGDVSYRGTCTQGDATVTADVSLKQGWNAVILEITDVTTSDGFLVASKIKQYVATSESGFNWYFDAW